MPASLSFAIEASLLMTPLIAIALVTAQHVYPGDRHAIAAVLLALGADAAASLLYRSWRHARSPVALAVH
jgi:hypothetical protein